MAERAAGGPRAVLELTPAEREQRGLSPDDVRDALLETIEGGDREAKVFEGRTFPALSLDHRTVGSADTHPVVFRDCSFTDGINAVGADLQVPVRFEGCTMAGVDLEGARIEHDLAIRDTEVTGAVEGFEARFEGDLDVTGTTFAASVTLDEASFADDTSFDGATFEAAASFRAAAFSGTSNELDDNASFDGTTFEAGADFQQATFEFASFEGVTIDAVAHFEETRFDGDATFAGGSFGDEADFDEARFGEDVAFDDAAFAGSAVFRGATFEGGARSLQDDARFVDVAFREEANFRDAAFRYVNFGGAAFDGHAMFEEARFAADADFEAAQFADEADFDEARFDGDADFSGARFERAAVFRGAVFEGQARHLERNAVFTDVDFAGEVDFDNAAFTSANFRGARFGGETDFTGAAFDALELHAEAADDDAYVDFTDAVLKEGTITQPAEHWVRYDLTRASLGDVRLAAERPDGQREILDYFRFCNTEFNEFDGYAFDFSAHTYYLDRNDWTLHAFEPAGPDREYALEMTPEHVETTYLKAKQAASAGGYVKAAGEFRVLRQRYARRKHLAIARDASADLAARLSNASRAAENAFLDLTCGFGMRLGRILAVFLVAPLLPGLLYAFGGRPFLTGAGQLSSLSALLTPAGRAVLFQNVYFSYITFLTIGYGGIGPKGALARLLAGLEVYLSVVLGGLVLYALIKRSEL